MNQSRAKIGTITTRTLAVLALAVCCTACASTIQYASLNDAQKKYRKGAYEKTLVLLSQAESVRSLSADQKAASAYLKARAFEGLGRIDEARVLYQYLREQHPDSQYAYLAGTSEQTTP